MLRLLPLRIVALALVLGGSALPGCATNDQCTPGVACTGDAKISEDVRASLATHPELAAPNVVYVQTRNGIVYLTGQVTTGLLHDTAEAAARATPGVKRVVNNISISYRGR
jgi:osmotically-inducible protein OsmY